MDGSNREPKKSHILITASWQVAEEKMEVAEGWWTLYLRDIPIAGWDSARGGFLLGAGPAFDSDGTYRMATTEKHPWHSVEIVSKDHGG